MTEILLINDLLEERSQELLQADGLLEFFESKFGRYPDHARIFQAPVCKENEVTPQTTEDAEKLATLNGPFVVLLCPGDPAMLLATLQWIAVAVSVATVIFAAEPPVATQRNVQNESPNNGLSDRTNQARPKGRIPDIYGTVRSTPDMLMVPYKRFVDHVEVEDSFLCVGRGSYQIQNAENGRPDVRDGTTPVNQIAGEAVEVYAPFTGPGQEPQLRIGNAINRPILSTQRLSSVNGQTLQPSDSGGSYRNLTRFISPNVVQSDNPDVDFTTMFVPGDSIQIEEAEQTVGEYAYEALIQANIGFGSINGSIITPGDITADWAAGQVMTIRASALPYTVPGQGDDSDWNGSLAIDGPYTIFSVAFTTGVDIGDPGYTTIVLQNVASVNGAWYTVGLARDRSTHPGPATLTRPSGVVQFDLSGTYTINTLTSSSMTLNDPASVNTDWNVLEDEYGGISRQLRPRIFTSGERWIDGGVLSAAEPIRGFIANMVALQGMYADNGQQQFAQTVGVVLEATPTNSAGEPLPGAVPELFPSEVVGSSTTRATRAVTIEGTFAASSRYWRFRARRTSPKNLGFNGQVVDEVKWRDLFGASPVDMPHFGDVTTLQAVRLATDGALAINDPKLNLLVTRRLPQRVSGSAFTPELYATNDVADILAAICLDPRIGNRSVEDVDFDNFYDTSAAIKAYFGFDEAAQFNYTIDNDNLSGEETIRMVAEAVFCTAYRRGRVIRLQFERETEDSAILFNHRNKLPGSEVRTTRFRAAQANDGIEYQYVDPADDGLVTIHLPEDRSALAPKRIESVGVRNEQQAMVHAWRAWNRLRYQHTTAVFNATAEANLLTLQERVLLADNTRPNAQDGDVLDVDGLELFLSQPVALQAGQEYRIWLQGSDRAVEGIAVTQGQSRRHVVLAHAPRRPLVTDGRAYARTTYVIDDGANGRKAHPFLLTEKGAPDDDTTIPLTCINYDRRYYQNDRMFAA